MKQNSGNCRPILTALLGAGVREGIFLKLTEKQNIEHLKPQKNRPDTPEKKLALLCKK